MKAVHFVISPEPGMPWMPLATLRESDPPGSISSDDPDGREVIVFGFHDGEPGVWRSRAGFDVADAVARTVFAVEGLEQISDLAEPYECQIWRGMRLVPVRWSLVDGRRAARLLERS